MEWAHTRGRSVILFRNPQTTTVEVNPPDRTRRTWLIVCAALVVVLIAATVLLRHFTGPAYVEKQLSKKLGPEYLVDIGSSHYNPFTQSFALGNLTIVSDTLRTPKKNRDHPHLNIKLNVHGVRANGYGMRALLNGRTDMSSIVFDRPKLRLYIDRMGMPVDHPRPPKSMPHETLLKSGKPIRIDIIRVVDADVSYAERSRTGVRPGIFRFGNLNATIEHVNNNANQHERPCLIDARTTLANSGRLHAVFKYDLSSPRMRMDYSATMGKMDGHALNDLLVDLNGIRIDEGTIDSARLSFKVDGDVATGHMKFLYHGLKLEVLDKDTHEQDMRDHMTTWMQNWQTHSENPRHDGEPPVVVTVRRQRLPHIALAKFVWETVREGILRSVGAPPK